MDNDQPDQEIIFVTRKWPPAMGGMETYSIRLVEELQSRANVTTFALPGQENGAPPTPLSLMRFGILTFVSLLAPKNRADVLHLGDMAIWPLAIATKLRRGTKTIALSAHGTDVSYPLRGTLRGKIYGMYLRLGGWFLRKSPVIANSEATATEAMKYGFKNTTIIPLATDFQRAHSDLNSNQLLFVGRIIPLKGLGWFVKNVLPKLSDEISLHVAGTVWDDDEAKCLEHDRVTFLGRLPQDELASASSAALAVVMPNLDTATRQFEGFGLAAIEVAAAGGIVLASDHGGLKEAVISNKTGMILPAGDAQAWVDAINDLRSWPKTKRDEFIQNSTATVETKYSWKRVAEDTLAAYAQT